MDFTLNFVGVAVADFARSLRFYTQILGVEARDAKENWAFLETTGLVWELFGEGGPPPGDRPWGRGRANRPAIHVVDLLGTISELQARGATFAGDVERSGWGDRIELVAPEGIRWSLVQVQELPSATLRDVGRPRPAPLEVAGSALGLRHPHLGWVKTKAHDVAGQTAFFADVMVLRSEDAGDGRVVFRQRPGGALLFLEGGGQPAPAWRGGRTEGNPVRLSFETADIGRAATVLRARGARILVDVTEQDWGGIDMIVADGDGYPIQVVQYLGA